MLFYLSSLIWILSASYRNYLIPTPQTSRSSLSLLTFHHRLYSATSSSQSTRNLGPAKYDLSKVIRKSTFYEEPLFIYLFFFLSCLTSTYNLSVMTDPKNLIESESIWRVNFIAVETSTPQYESKQSHPNCHLVRSK